MQKFMIGRDLESETITIPAFWEDGKLAGIIGRYIDPKRPKNMRFKIYEFPKGSLIYPLDKLRVIDDTIIGVEAMFDAQLMHKWNYPNTVAMMGDGMSRQQADMIASRCKRFIDLFDNDEGGRIARDIAKKALGNRVMYMTCDYPDWGKDPGEWGEEVTNDILSTAHFIRKELPRI
jgi:DNA primase